MEFKEFAYCSDKYQYTMGKSFMDCGKGEKIAVFNYPKKFFQRSTIFEIKRVYFAPL